MSYQAKLISSLLLLVYLLRPLPGKGQRQSSGFLEGKVKDGQSGEVLPMAKVSLPELAKGTFSDVSGGFQLAVPTDSFKIVISIAGYESLSRNLLIRQDTSISFFLYPEGGPNYDLDAVEITSSPKEDALSRNQMSYLKLGIEKIRSLPVIFGEVDPLKTIQLLPGVQSGSEASNGLYVRGGGPDQNLVLLDEVPLYNASHLFGFLSIFNGDAVEEIELFKGAFPARYGSRLSSILNIDTKPGSFRKWGVTGGIGIISSRLSVEGPLVKDKLSVRLTGRRTYVDVFTRWLNNQNVDNEAWIKIPDYFFHDVNGRLDWKAGQRDHLFVSSYYGLDKFDFQESNFILNFKWTNRTSSLGWKHLYSSKLIQETAVFLNHFDYGIDNSYDDQRTVINSQIRDLGFKTGLTWLKTPRQQFRTGLTLTRHVLNPTAASGIVTRSDSVIDAFTPLKNLEGAIYLSGNFHLNNRSQLSAGLRVSGMAVSGKVYVNPEPRISFLRRINGLWTFRASYSRMVQYIHLISNSAVSLPTDIWYPSTDRTRPQIADQLAMGSTVWMEGPALEITVETFGKFYQNLVEYKEGTRILSPENPDNDLTYGLGWSFGTELLVQRKIGALTGWLGYTLSWTYRLFDDLNFGEAYPNKFDRRHDVSIVLAWEVNPKLTLSAAWVYGSGNATTLPSGRFIAGDINNSSPVVVPNVRARNDFRLPSFQHLDLGVVWNLNPEKDHSQLALNVYNLYNRRNTFFIYFEEILNEDETQIERYAANQVSLFPIIPSLTYNFRF